MKRPGKLIVVTLLAAVTLFAGCRTDEQNRPLHFEKGKYQGQKDQSLDAEQLKALRERAEQAH